MLIFFPTTKRKKVVKKKKKTKTKIVFVSSNLLPPDSDSDGRDGEEQSTGMQSKKVPSSPEITFL